MLRAYIRKIKGMSVQAQKALAEKDGVTKAVYEEPTGDVSKVQADAIASIRSGDLLWIADATVLADGRTDYLRVLQALSDKKIAVREGRTGRTSQPPHDGQFMVLDASKRWSSANKGFGAMTPEDAGALGGKVTARHRRKFKLPKAECAKLWFDKALWHLDTDQITDKINAYGRELGYHKTRSKTALYRLLGKRGVDAGPKVKK